MTLTISQKELERVAALAYEGETMRAMLCNVGVTGYTAQSTVADWQSVEVSGNGYVRGSQVIGTGSYSGTEGAYVIPEVINTFSATGVGYQYDRVVYYIQGATYPYAVEVEDPNIVLSPGQSQTYRLSLLTDD